MTRHGLAPSYTRDFGWAALLLPLLLPTAFVFGSWLFDWSLTRNYAYAANLKLFAPNPDSTLVAANRLAGRIIWVTFNGISTALTAIAILAGAWIWRELWTRNRQDNLLGYGKISLKVFFALIIVGIGIVIWTDYAWLYTAILRPWLLQKELPSADSLQRWSDRIGLLLALGFGALASLIVPRSTCVDPARLRRRMGQLRLLLVLMTVLLVVDVLRTDALLQWAMAAFSDSKETISTVRSLAFAIVSVRGLYATILVAVIYLPAALLLQEQARAAAETAIQSPARAEDIDKWLKAQGLLTPEPLAQARPIVTLLLPLLAGLVGGPGLDFVKTLAVH
jgi:hypothetical protein